MAVNKSNFKYSKADLLEINVALSKILASLSRVTDHVCSDLLLVFCINVDKVRR